MDLTEAYTIETHETPFDHTGGYSYDFTKWVIKVAEVALEEVTALEEDAAGASL